MTTTRTTIDRIQEVPASGRPSHTKNRWARTMIQATTHMMGARIGSNQSIGDRAPCRCHSGHRALVEGTRSRCTPRIGAPATRSGPPTSFARFLRDQRRRHRSRLSLFLIGAVIDDAVPACPALSRMWDMVDPAARPGVAAQQAVARQNDAGRCSPPADRIDCVVRTARVEAAPRRKKRRDRALVATDETQQGTRRDTRVAAPTPTAHRNRPAHQPGLARRERVEPVSPPHPSSARPGSERSPASGRARRSWPRH